MTPEVSMTRPLANVLRIAALAAVVVFASAFDWKPKTTAKLKADLVAYANSVGETELANAVKGASGTAEWMRAAIKRGSELLKASEGADFDDKNRERGLRIIDYPLHLDNYDRERSSAEDKKAFNEVVHEYCVSARERVFSEVAAAKIPKGSLRLWRIYNMGYIIKGPKHTVAIDITARPELYTIGDKYLIKDTNTVIWCKSDWKRLADLADMIFVTHPHGDHYNRDGIEAFIAAKKPVVVPCDLVAYATNRPAKKGPDGKYVVEKEILTTAPCCVKLTEDHLEPVDVGGVKVRNFRGNQGENVPCNVYLIDIDAVEEIESVDWLDLGMPEARWNLKVKDFGPLIVAMDCHGNSLYD